MCKVKIRFDVHAFQDPPFFSSTVTLHAIIWFHHSKGRSALQKALTFKLFANKQDHYIKRIMYPKCGCFITAKKIEG
jgi:hypothetical protein